MNAVGCRLVCALLRPLARIVAAGTGAGVIISVVTRRPEVALTVDDGPSPSTTPLLLAVLRRHGARATFFLIGERAAAHPELVAAIVADGHELGNHLLRDEWSVRLPRTVFRDQLRAVDELLRRSGEVRFFRPGSGWFSRRMLRQAADLGYRCVLGSPLLVPTAHRPGTGERLAGHCHPGAVVVLHEGTATRAGVGPVADAMLGRLAGRGLRCVTLTQLTRS